MGVNYIRVYIIFYVFLLGVVFAQQGCDLQGAYDCTGGSITGIYLGDDEDDDSFEYYASVGNSQSNSCSIVQQGTYVVNGDILNVDFTIDDDECIITGQSPELCDCVFDLEFTISNSCTRITASSGEVCDFLPDCDDRFTCPGNAQPIPDPNYQPSANGCGPSGFPLTAPSFAF